MGKRLQTRCAAAFSLLLLASAGSAAAEEIVIIVNAANPNATLTAQQVKAYFLKKSATWQNGEKVRPVDHEGESPERKAFLAKVLGLSSDELKRHWLERQYATADQPAANVPDEASVVKFVAFFKGGVGFVSRSGLGKAEGVKAVLTVSF
jgi:ABC-type phosphate transport system substrate-binding protein